MELNIKLMAKQKTQSEWIKLARSIWGDKYDYSKVKYINSKTHVTITCPLHGTWQCIPSNHTKKISPRGCPKCGREKQKASATKPFDKFVNDANRVHDHQYEYDRDSYLGAKEKTNITCPQHGVFKQTPDAHINGKQGCPSCAQLKLTESKLLPVDVINQRLGMMSNGLVIIDASSYKGVNKKATFTCAVHGRFTRLVNSVINGVHACLICAQEEGKYFCYTSSLFRKVIKEKYQGRYQVKPFKYEGKKTVVTLVCKKHGKFQIQAASIRRSPGCPRCAYISSMGNRTQALRAYNKNMVSKRYEAWLNKARKNHGDRYDYSMVNYIDAKTPVKIICPVHGITKQVPDTHLIAGCRKCADEDLKGIYTENYFHRFPDRKSLPAKLYYVMFEKNNLYFYKVGITIATIKHRFSAATAAGLDLTVLKEHQCSLYDAFQREQEIQKAHGARFRFSPLIKGIDNRTIRISANECFSKKLDKQTIFKYFN